MLHSHSYSLQTSVHEGHCHGIKGETSKAESGEPHVHFIVGYTDSAKGHRHYYALQTGINNSCEGGHFHYIQGMTLISEEHYHNLTGSA